MNVLETKNLNWEKANSLKNSLENSFYYVFWIDNECAISIIEGVSEYNNDIYYFECIYSDIESTYTKNYELTLLDKSIFDLKLWNINYLTEWHKNSQNVPFWKDYEEDREEYSFEELETEEWYGKSEMLKKAEIYYQNDKKINNYIKISEPKYIIEGTFYIDNIEYNITKRWYEHINEYSKKVKWETF